MRPATRSIEMTRSSYGLFVFVPGVVASHRICRPPSRAPSATAATRPWYRRPPRVEHRGCDAGFLGATRDQLADRLRAHGRVSHPDLGDRRPPRGSPPARHRSTVRRCDGWTGTPPDVGARRCPRSPCERGRGDAGAPFAWSSRPSGGTSPSLPCRPSSVHTRSRTGSPCPCTARACGSSGCWRPSRRPGPCRCHEPRSGSAWAPRIRSRRVAPRAPDGSTRPAPPDPCPSGPLGSRPRRSRAASRTRR